MIARELSESGVEPPRAKGKPWSSTMVLRLLRKMKNTVATSRRKSRIRRISWITKNRSIGGREEQIPARPPRADRPTRSFRASAADLRAAPAGARRDTLRPPVPGARKASFGYLRPPLRSRAGGGAREVRYTGIGCAPHGGRHGPRHTHGRGTPDGCDMRMMPHQALCTCMDVVVERLGAGRRPADPRTAGIGGTRRRTAACLWRWSACGKAQKAARATAAGGRAGHGWDTASQKRELDSLRRVMTLQLSLASGRAGADVGGTVAGGAHRDSQSAFLRAFLETEALGVKRCTASFGTDAHWGGGVPVRLRTGGDVPAAICAAQARSWPAAGGHTLHRCYRIPNAGEE